MYFGKQVSKRAEMTTQIVRKRFFFVTDVRAIRNNSQTFNVCNGRVHKKHLMKAPNYTKEILPEKPCETDVLCNWAITLSEYCFACGSRTRSHLRG